jgi:protein-S-isoprenylcysteine O-methyltransferase Ste14
MCGANCREETSQKIAQTIASIGFAAILVVSALDHRFAWTSLPLYISLVGDALVAIGFLIIFIVYRENTFASATIELAPDQKVVSSGLYALVRHPMYIGSPFLISWYTPLARLVVGIIRDCLDDACAHMETT